MKYVVEIEGQTFEVELDGDRIAVGGREVDAEILEVPGTPVKTLRVDGASHSFTAQRKKPGHWRLGLKGGPVDVVALDERTRAIREMAGAGEGEADKVIAAPMPGLVVRIPVAVGDSVAAGQGVIVVEAMKMENELKAPADGVIAAIEVEAGQAVDKGAVLVVLE